MKVEEENITEIEKAKQAYNRVWEEVSLEVGRKSEECDIMETKEGESFKKERVVNSTRSFKISSMFWEVPMGLSNGNITGSLSEN